MTMATNIAKRIAELLTRPGNDSCSDCDRPNNEPHWASFFVCPVDNRRLGVLCCPKCAHLHQTVGDGEFTLKGLNDEEFNERDIEDIEVSGNNFVNKVYEFGVTNEKEGRDKRPYGYEAYFFEKMMNLTYFNDELYTHLIISSLRAQVLERVTPEDGATSEEEKKEDDKKSSTTTKDNEKTVDRRPTRDDKKASSKDRDREKLEMAAALPLFQLTAGRRSTRAGTNDDLRRSSHQPKPDDLKRSHHHSSKPDDLKRSHHHSKHDDLRRSHHQSKSPHRERPASSSKDHRDDSDNKHHKSSDKADKSTTDQTSKDSSPKREDQDDSSNGDEDSFCCDTAETDDEASKEPSKSKLPQSILVSSDDKGSKGDLDLNGSQRTASSRSRTSKGDSDPTSTKKSDDKDGSQHTTSSSRSKGSKGDSDRKSDRKDSKDHKSKDHKSDRRGSKEDSDIRAASTHSNEDKDSKGDTDLRTSQHNSTATARKGRFDMSCDARKERMREQRKNALKASGGGGKRDVSPKRSSVAVFRFPRETSRDKLSSARGMRRTRSSGGGFGSSRSSKEELLGGRKDHNSSSNDESQDKKNAGWEIKSKKDESHDNKKNAGWESKSSKKDESHGDKKNAGWESRFKKKDRSPSPVNRRRRTISLEDPPLAPSEPKQSDSSEPTKSTPSSLPKNSNNYNPELLRHQMRIECLIKAAPVAKPELRKSMIEALISTAPVHVHDELKTALKKHMSESEHDETSASTKPEDSKSSEVSKSGPRPSLTISSLGDSPSKSRPSLAKSTSNRDLNPRAHEIGMNRRASLARTGSAHEIMSSSDGGDQDRSSTKPSKKESPWDILRSRRADLIRFAKEQEMADRKGKDRKATPDSTGSENKVNLLAPGRRGMLARRSTSRRNVMEQQMKSTLEEAADKEAVDNQDEPEHGTKADNEANSGPHRIMRRGVGRARAPARSKSVELGTMKKEGADFNRCTTLADGPSTSGSSKPESEDSTTQKEAAQTPPKKHTRGWAFLKSRRADFIKLAKAEEAGSNDAAGNQAAADMITSMSENKANHLGPRRGMLARRSTSRRNIMEQQLKSAVDDAADKEESESEDVAEENGSEVDGADGADSPGTTDPESHASTSTTQEDPAHPKKDNTGWELLKSRRADFVKLARGEATSNDAPGTQDATDVPNAEGENKANAFGSRRGMLTRRSASRRNIMEHQLKSTVEEAAEKEAVDSQGMKRGVGRGPPARSKSAELGAMKKVAAVVKRCTTLELPSATGSSSPEGDASTTQEESTQTLPKKNASSWDLLKSRQADFMKLAMGEATNNDADDNQEAADETPTTEEKLANILDSRRGLLAGRGASRRNMTRCASSSPMRPGTASMSPPPGPSQVEDSEQTTPRRAAFRRGLSMGHGRARSMSKRNLMLNDDDNETPDSETPQKPYQSQAEDLEPTTPRRAGFRRGLSMGGRARSMSKRNLMVDDESEKLDPETAQRPSPSQAEDLEPTTPRRAAFRRGLSMGHGGRARSMSKRNLMVEDESEKVDSETAQKPSPSQAEDSELTTPRRALPRRGLSLGGRGRSSSVKNLKVDDAGETPDVETPQQSNAPSLAGRGPPRRGMMQRGSSFKMRRGRSIGHMSTNHDEDPSAATTQTTQQLPRGQSARLNYNARPSYRISPKQEEDSKPAALDDDESKHDDGLAEQEEANESAATGSLGDDTPAAAPAKRGADYYKQKLHTVEDKRHSLLSAKKKQERRNVPACA